MVAPTVIMGSVLSIPVHRTKTCVRVRVIRFNEGLVRGSSIKIEANMSARVGVRVMELRLGLELSLGFRFRVVST